MTFTALERRGAAPVEFYRFHRGSTQIAAYTSSDIGRNLAISTALGGLDNTLFTFMPAPIEREAVEGTDERSGTGLKVKLLVSDTETATITDLYVAGVPATPVELSVYRAHRGSRDVRRIFFGDITGAEIEGGVLTLNCEPKHAALQQGILRQLYQGPCNNTLGDSFCGVNLAALAVAGTVDTITADGLTIEVSEADASPDGYFGSGGRLAFGTRLGFLTSHVGAELKLFRRVPGLIVGSSVSLTPGCDRTLTTCTNTFANTANHMGFPLIPTRDPFTTGAE